MEETGVSRDRLEHDALAMTEAEFGAAHPGPFLAFDVPAEDDELNYLTEIPNQPATRKNVVVAPIRARGRVSDEVTVGRAEENDVAIRDASVSKLHAHFRTVDAALTLTDLASHNGTKLGGVAIAANRPVPVSVGAMITFGSTATRVIDVHEAYVLLRR